MAGSKTILFIEDDPFVVDMYKHALTRAGYLVDVAFDGRKGYQKAMAKRYDLLLIDIMIPEMTGIEVLEKLRGLDGKGLSGTRVVILTNLAQSEESRRALEAKADGYLIKADVTPSKLVALLDQVMSGSA